jgi:predicted site-specific integrase-resolvase
MDTEKEKLKLTHVSSNEAAQLLCVSPRTVLSWIKACHLMAAKLPNGRYVVPLTEIDRLTTSTTGTDGAEI